MDQPGRQQSNSTGSGRDRRADQGSGEGAQRGAPVGPYTAPAISVPKGGGAIRGIGEKFAANPATGAGSLSIPIAVAPGRSGFGPQLALTYDSSSGNGPFGFGWSLSIPSITRKTDKGLPRYRDDDSDVFILTGAEDLVPSLVQGRDGWVRVETSLRDERPGPRSPWSTPPTRRGPTCSRRMRRSG